MRGRRRRDLVQLGRSLVLTDYATAVLDVLARKPERPNPLGPPVVVRCAGCPRLPDGRLRPVAECTCYDEILRSRT